MGGGEPDIEDRFLVARKTGWLRALSIRCGLHLM